MDTIILKGCKQVEIPYVTSMISKDDECLIVGEKNGGEGVFLSILSKSNKITCTDIDCCEDIVKKFSESKDINFIQTDFIKFNEIKKYDVIVCVNVLEHFGMIFGGKEMFDSNSISQDKILLWNHDLKGIQKMCSLLKDEKSKVIITVPCSPYFFFEDDGTPYQRCYEHKRIKVIKKFVENIGYKIINEKFYYTENFLEWFESDDTISMPQCYNLHNCFTPNVIWGFTITK